MTEYRVNGCELRGERKYKFNIEISVDKSGIFKAEFVYTDANRRSRIVNGMFKSQRDEKFLRFFTVPNYSAKNGSPEKLKYYGLSSRQGLMTFEGKYNGSFRLFSIDDYMGEDIVSFLDNLERNNNRREGIVATDITIQGWAFTE